MRRILCENAYEAWSTAIKECDTIYSGLVTLNHQKQFVSALHNSVELFVKQIMLDRCDHDVAHVRKIYSIETAQLAYDYYAATNLNEFFSAIPASSVDKFASIEFGQLIDKYGTIVGNDASIASYRAALKQLQVLRNNETHFMISETMFLSEGDFILLYNFMIDFYNIIKALDLLPFWGKPHGEKARLAFPKSHLTTFSYKEALKNNKFAQTIVRYLKTSQEYGSPNSSPYNIAISFCSSNTQFHDQFDDVWAIIEMLQKYHAITYTEEVTEIPDDLQQDFSGPIVDYTMMINL